MLRGVLAVAAVLAVTAVGLGQERSPDPEREKQVAEWQKRRDKYLEKHPTEVPDLVGKVGTQVKLPKVEVGKDDSPVVKASKRAMLAEMDAIEKINMRVIAGQFQGGASYVQLMTAAMGLYSSAQVVWDDPENLLPWAEYQLQTIVAAEDFNAPRVEQGVEEPQLMPQLRAARYKAEVVVLQLREKAKKK